MSDNVNDNGTVDSRLSVLNRKVVTDTLADLEERTLRVSFSTPVKLVGLLQRGAKYEITKIDEDGTIELTFLEPASVKTFRSGGVIVDADKGVAYNDKGEVYPYTKTMWRLLLTLGKYLNTTVTGEKLLIETWGVEWQNDKQYLRVWISRLRMTGLIIETVDGIGYRLIGEFCSSLPAEKISQRKYGSAKEMVEDESLQAPVKLMSMSEYEKELDEKLTKTKGIDKDAVNAHRKTRYN